MNGMGEEIGLRNLSIFAIKFDCFFERGGGRIFFYFIIAINVINIGRGEKKI